MLDRTLIPIAIQSCLSQPDAAERRAGCQETWIPTLSGYFLPVFLVGVANLDVDYRYTHAEPAGFLEIRCDDTLDSLSTKIKMFCRWALETFTCGWAFKCDDDSYLNGRLFNDYPFGLYDYVGCIYRTGDGVLKAHGGGYSLSRRCLELVAAQLPIGQHDEDWLVGKIVYTLADLKAKYEETITPWSFTKMRHDAMVGHFIRGREQMMQVHRNIICAA